LTKEFDATLQTASYALCLWHYK